MSSIIDNLRKLRRASYAATSLSADLRNKVIVTLADLLIKQVDDILLANQADLGRMDKDDPKYDRLLLTKERISGIASDLHKVAGLISPIGELLEERNLPNGIHLQKVRVPLGVVAVIYESRPNVTIDVFALCFKTGNGVVLKGGSEARDSNQILVKLIQQSLRQNGIDDNLIYLMPPERETIQELLDAVGLVDVCIPRGSQRLIEFVRENAKIPVIETGAGIVHLYFDKAADMKQGQQIIYNAKTRRVSVCNALDTLVIHRDRLQDLPSLVRQLAEKQVQIFADKDSYQSLIGGYPSNLLNEAGLTSFGTEFLDYKLAIKTVANIDEAILHVMSHTSGHSEAIISEDPAVVERFMREIDAAVIYANASTAFTDGGEFGMGAEIGISTQKLHARGPMALPELTSYKWLAYGNGQVR